MGAVDAREMVEAEVSTAPNAESEMSQSGDDKKMEEASKSPSASTLKSRITDTVRNYVSRDIRSKHRNGSYSIFDRLFEWH